MKHTSFSFAPIRGVLITWHTPLCTECDGGEDEPDPVVRPRAYFDGDWLYVGALGFEASVVLVNLPVLGGFFRKIQQAGVATEAEIERHRQAVADGVTSAVASGDAAP